MREKLIFVPFLITFTACGTSTTSDEGASPDANADAPSGGAGGGNTGGSGTGGGGMNGGGSAGASSDARSDVTPTDGSNDGGPCVPVADHVVSDAAGASSHPAIAWNGSGYAIAFPDDRSGTLQIHLAFLDARGNKMGTDLPISMGARAAGLPDLVYDGSGYGLSYTTETPAPPVIHFARLSPAGAVVGNVLDVGDGAGIHSLVWSGTQYGLAYGSGRNAGFGSDIYFARIGSTAALIGTELRVTDDPGSEFIPMAGWNETNYGMVFLHGAVEGGAIGGIYFAAVDANGAEIGNEALIPNANGGQARLAASPTGYAMTWRTTTTGVFTRLDTSGRRTAAVDVMLPNAPSDVIWSGTRYAAAWSLPTDSGAGGEVFLQTYPAADGSPGSAVMVSSGAVAEVNAISIASNTSGFGVAWADSRATPAEIHFAAVCP